MVGVAVNVTEVPAHIAPDGNEEIITAGVTVGVTVIVIMLDVAVTGLAHVALDVITQVTTSLLASVLLT